MNGLVWERIKLLESPTKTERALIEKLDALAIEDLIYTSITELSDITGVAEATIVRFLGFAESSGLEVITISSLCYPRIYPSALLIHLTACHKQSQTTCMMR